MTQEEMFQREKDLPEIITSVFPYKIKEVSRELLSYKENWMKSLHYHKEIFRDDNKIIFERRYWNNSYVSGDFYMDLEYVNDDMRYPYEVKRPQYLKDGLTCLLTEHETWDLKKYFNYQSKIKHKDLNIDEIDLWACKSTKISK